MRHLVPHYTRLLQKKQSRHKRSNLLPKGEGQRWVTVLTMAVSLDSVHRYQAYVYHTNTVTMNTSFRSDSSHTQIRPSTFRFKEERTPERTKSRSSQGLSKQHGGSKSDRQLEEVKRPNLKEIGEKSEETKWSEFIFHVGSSHSYVKYVWDIVGL